MLQYELCVEKCIFVVDLSAEKCSYGHGLSVKNVCLLCKGLFFKNL